MIGTGKGTGKVIYEGWAKSDDPIYKEGWLITMPHQASEAAHRTKLMSWAVQSKMRCSH